MSEKPEHCDNPTCQETADRAVKKVFAILGGRWDADIRFPRCAAGEATRGNIMWINRGDIRGATV